MMVRIVVSGLGDADSAAAAARAGADFLVVPTSGPAAAWADPATLADLTDRCELIGVVDPATSVDGVNTIATELDLDFVLAAPPDEVGAWRDLGVRWIADLTGAAEPDPSSVSGAAWAIRTRLARASQVERSAAWARANRLICRVDPKDPSWPVWVESVRPFAVEFEHAAGLVEWVGRLRP